MHIPTHNRAKPDSHPCDDTDLHAKSCEQPPGVQWHLKIDLY